MFILRLDGLDAFEDCCNPFVFVASQSVLMASGWLYILLLGHPCHLPKETLDMS